MGALLAVCGGKDYEGLKPKTQVCIIDQSIEDRETGALVRQIFIEIPLFMGEQYAKRLARTLGITPICHKIARNERCATWIVRYDRKGPRPVRRITRLLRLDPSVFHIHVERSMHITNPSNKRRA